jgi:hypothetical protein
MPQKETNFVNIEIRLQLWTPHGPAGHRLERAVPLPIKEFNYPDTLEGRKSAEKARDHLQDYVTKYVGPKRK